MVTNSSYQVNTNDSSSVFFFFFYRGLSKSVSTYAIVKGAALTKTAIVASIDHNFALCLSTPSANCISAQCLKLGEI